MGVYKYIKVNFVRQKRRHFVDITSVLPRKQVNILIGRILKRQFTSFSSVVLILAKCFGAKQYESPKVNNKKMIIMW